MSRSEDESSNTSSSESSGNEQLDYHRDSNGEYIVVHCREQRALLYPEKFAGGSVGKCVLFSNNWLTVVEFEACCGSRPTGEWRRAIRSKGLMLDELIREGIINEHEEDCSCGLCRRNKEAELVLVAKKRRLSQATSVRMGSPGSDGHSSAEEYRPQQQQAVEPGDTARPDSVIDISDFIPRRSTRKPRKTKGHRTELGTYTTAPSDWDSEEVAEFLRQQGFTDYATPFLRCGIDGQSLFLLKEHHLFERFNMKLGPALCFLDVVSKLKHPPIS